MQHLGIVGLPNAGKSTLFNALTGGNSPVAPFPFSTTSTHRGEAKVVDRRLDLLSAFSRSAKTTPAVVRFTDIGALVPGAGAGSALGSDFLGGIREVDALLLVLRTFVDPAVEGEDDPTEALHCLELELCAADSESLERQLAKRRRQAKGETLPKGTLECMERALSVLNSATPLWRSRLSAEDRSLLASCFLLTDKPVLVVFNTDPDAAPDAGGWAAGAGAGADADAGGWAAGAAADAGAGAGELAAGAAAGVGAGAEEVMDIPELQGRTSLSVCARLEAELMSLPEAERAEYAKELGLGDGALQRIARAAYELLGLQTFFTTGPKETRAWQFPDGATAAECTGLIHTDIQRGFIRAECIDWEALLAEGSEAAARRSGKIRSEGRNYLPRDGEVIEVRFNV